MLDAQAKAAYRRRLVELRAELEEAEAFHDAGRTARARAEMEAISEQLAGAVGLGGRDRRAASASERARSAVTKRIAEALKRIAEASPALADHLRGRVRTGTFCVYVPDAATNWRGNCERASCQCRCCGRIRSPSAGSGGRPGSDICPLSRSHPRHRGPGEGFHERGGAGVQHR